MNRQRLAIVLPLAVAIIFFILAFSRPHQRGVWLSLGLVSLVIGAARRRASRAGDL